MEPHIPETNIIFDYGGVLLDWNPRYLYRKMFNGDEGAMEHFLGKVCSLEWNAQLDKGRPFAETITERIQEYPAYTPYIQAYQDR